MNANFSPESYSTTFWLRGEVWRACVRLETRLTGIKVRLRNMFAHAVMASVSDSWRVDLGGIWACFGCLWRWYRFVKVWWCAGTWQYIWLISSLGLGWDKIRPGHFCALTAQSNTLNMSATCSRHQGRTQEALEFWANKGLRLDRQQW